MKEIRVHWQAQVILISEFDLWEVARHMLAAIILRDSCASAQAAINREAAMMAVRLIAARQGDICKSTRCLSSGEVLP